MFNRKLIVLAIFLISLFAVSAVAAADNATGDVAGIQMQKENVVDVEYANNLSNDNSDCDIVGIVQKDANDSDAVYISENDEMLSKCSNDSVEISGQSAIGAEDVNSTVEVTSDCDVLSVSVNQTDPVLSAVYSDASVYLIPVKTTYNSGKYIHMGWNGYFCGYFKVYKGYSLYYREYISGYDRSLKWSLKGMSPGTYVAELVDEFGPVLGKAKIVIARSSSVIRVNSFSTKAGYDFYCYAYVKDRYSGRNYNGGNVKFYIAGKVYKAKLNHGVAVAKITIPSKVRTYRCIAKFSGGTNVRKKSTFFYMVVKKTDLLTFKGKSKFSWKIKASTWKKMKRQAVYNYVWLHRRGSYLPGYSDGITVTATKGGHKYTGTAYAVKTDRGIRCEVRCLPRALRATTWGDYYPGGTAKW